MNILFYKYQGTGNDFVIIDNRNNALSSLTQKEIKKICDRRFGVGADGLMLLQLKSGYDFEMIYFNADGNKSSMCGNGGRCIVAFANHLGIIKNKTQFIAIDGVHEAVVDKNLISLKMNNVHFIEKIDNAYYLNTGSPHYVTFVEDIENYNVLEEGRKIRNNNRFKAEGTNVNFIEKVGDELFVRTYERGVEAETYSCGTGVTAAAIVASLEIKEDANYSAIKTLGGNLKVKFIRDSDHSFSNIWLEGPATFVFKGEINSL